MLRIINKQISKCSPLFTNQKGNIFFALFGAVAIVGLLGTAIVSTMRGPLTTMVKVQTLTQAQSEMVIASRLALLEATELANDGDCDADGFVEPLEYTDPGVEDAPTGGGFLPAAVASSRTDPWGTKYGYCAWDAGTENSSTAGACPAANRLDGTGDGDETYTVLAIVSAGPDQVFGTTCVGGASPAITKTGDDIITEFTYASASASTGGLWNIKSGDPTTAEITKNLEVTGGAAFTAGIDLTGSTAALQLGAASMLFPNQVTLATCNGANDGLVRIDTTADPDVLQLCDNPNGWVSVGGGVWTKGAGDDIYYDTGTFQVGIGKNNPTEALDIVGNIAASGNITAGGNLVAVGNLSGVDLAATGNAAIGGTLGVTGATTLTTLNATGAVDFDTTLNVDGDTTLIGTLDVTGATALVSTLDAQGDISDSLGDLTINDNLVVTGTSDLQGNVSNSIADLTLDDAVDITGNLDAQGTISNSTGNVAINDNTDVTGAITATANIDAGTTLNVNGDQLGPALNCTASQKLEWTNGSGWSCVTDQNDGSGGSGTDLGKWEINSGVLRTKDTPAPWTTTDFVFGSPQLADDGDVNHDARMFFDKSKGAFRAGHVIGTQWDDVNVGLYSTAMGSRLTASGQSSVAIGFATTASGQSSVAIGDNTSATGDYSIAMGYDTTSSGNYSFTSGETSLASGSRSTAIGVFTVSGGFASTAMGNSTTATGDSSTAFGRQVNISATGDGSAGFGLTTTSPATDPIISGEQSMGIFMGNHSAVVFSAANTMGLFGGRMVIDSAVPATNLAVSGGLELDVEGDIGAINYCDEDGNNCFTATSVAGGGGGKWSDGVDANDIYYNAGFVGIGTTDPDVSLAIIGTDAILLPVGTAAEQPSSPVEGMIRFNSDANVFEGYVDDGTPAWDPINTGSGGLWTDLTGGSIHYGSAGTGKVGIATATPEASLDVATTDSILIPRGTTAERPASPVNGMMRYNSTTAGFEVYEVGVWVGMGAAVSDKRLKADIMHLNNGDILDRLAQINTYSYSLNADKTGRTRYGVIAQELMKIFPELVDTPENPDEMKSVRYQELIAPMIAGMQRLKSENDMLKSELTEISEQVAILNNLVGDNVGKKASMQIYIFLLLGLIGGMGIMLIIKRKENN